MSWIKEVVSGWRNHLIPPEELKEAISKMSQERLLICRACPLDSINKGISILIKGEHCTQCGCPLAAKTKSPTSACPLVPPKWEAYLDLEEYEKIKKTLTA